MDSVNNRANSGERTAQKAPTSGAALLGLELEAGAVNCPMGRGRGGAEQLRYNCIGV
jgi:hypothetical protein